MGVYNALSNLVAGLKKYLGLAQDPDVDNDKSGLIIPVTITS